LASKEKKAVLAVWDRDRVVEIEVTWNKGYDVDASIKVPARFKPVWKAAVEFLREERGPRDTISPYGGLSQIAVLSRDLNKTATGAFAVASAIWPNAGWKVRPPYPEVEDPSEKVKP